MNRPPRPSRPARPGRPERAPAAPRPHAGSSQRNPQPGSATPTKTPPLNTGKRRDAARPEAKAGAATARPPRSDVPQGLSSHAPAALPTTLSRVPNSVDVVVLGAGAAGMMCAARAAQRGRRVLILDHASRLAEKIRISGGGRCNFTNRTVTPNHYLCQNPHFVRSALARFTPQDFIELVERYDIAYHERDHGQLFCDDSANDIIAMLRDECIKAGVQWAMPVTFESVEPLHNETLDVLDEAEAPRFSVRTSAGTVRCHSFVVATGGLAIPKIGATPLGYRLAEQFGLKVIPPRPALVPLTLPPETLNLLQELSGASLEVEARCVDGHFREAVLITHRGLSGPVILQVSNYWQRQFLDAESSEAAREPIHLNLLPGLDAAAWLAEHAHSASLLANVLAERLPRRFAHAWCALHGWEQPLRQYSADTLHTIATRLSNWALMPSGTQGYAKAEVTLGGVDTHNLSSKTMEALRCKGLYFIGEVMDVTGHLGGYNFQWAWASGHAAGAFV